MKVKELYALMEDALTYVGEDAEVIIIARPDNHVLELEPGSRMWTEKVVTLYAGPVKGGTER